MKKNTSKLLNTLKMKAMIVEDYCEQPDFKLVTDFEKPKVSSSKQILVNLKCASVNPVDYKLRKGAMKMVSSLKFPAILGKDGSGVIEEVGTKVGRFKVGDRVTGFLPNTKTGSYAEYAVFEEDELTLYPDQMSHEQAAAFPLAGCTVLEMYRRHPLIGEVLDREGENAYKNGKISDPISGTKKDLKILIIGASGGTGSIAVLVAKQFLSRYFNTKIYAVCSEKNSQFVSSLGADVVIDYNKTSAKAGAHTTHTSGGMSDTKSICQLISETHGDKYVDIVVDTVGGYYYLDDVSQNLDCKLAEKGVTFSTISTPNPNEYTMTFSSLVKMGCYLTTNKLKSLSSSYPSYHMVMLGKNAKDMNLLLNHIVASNDVYKLIPLIPFSLENTKDAHLQMESQRTVGKIIIKIE